jgi:hypothetical protein
MMKVFPRTREKEKGWKLATYSALGSLVAAPIVTLIARRGFTSRPFTEVGFSVFHLLEVDILRNIYEENGVLWKQVKC